MDLELVPISNIEIEFKGGGTISFRGRASMDDDTEIVGMDEEGTVENASGCTLEVIEDGLIQSPNMLCVLEAGIYRLDQNGLWPVVGGNGAAAA